MFKQVLNSVRGQKIIAAIIVWYIQLVADTTRWHIVGGLGAFKSAQPCIVAFWHETLPAMPVFWARGRPDKPAVVLASQHRDGRLIAMVVERLGIRVVAGSSSRGGAAGLRALVAALASGAHVGLTPDGPRGPALRAAPGIAMLAAMSGARILPCAASVAWAIPIKSWDRMRFPLPFGRGCLAIGPLLSVPRDRWEDELPKIEAALSAALTEAKRHC